MARELITRVARVEVSSRTRRVLCRYNTMCTNVLIVGRKFNNILCYYPYGFFFFCADDGCRQSLVNVPLALTILRIYIIIYIVLRVCDLRSTKKKKNPPHSDAIIDNHINVNRVAVVRSALLYALQQTYRASDVCKDILHFHRVVFDVPRRRVLPEFYLDRDKR